MLSSLQLIKYWLPGVAGTQPRLGPVLGGRLRKGGLHQPPFYFVHARHVSQTPIYWFRYQSCLSVIVITIWSLDVAPAHAFKPLVKKMSRQWGHWRLGRGGWRALHWSSISRAFTPHFLAHWYLGRAQQHQHSADRKDCQDHSNLQPRLPRTPSVSFQRTSLSLARPAHFHRYSPLPLVPLAVVPLYHLHQ